MPTTLSSRLRRTGRAEVAHAASQGIPRHVLIDQDHFSLTSWRTSAEVHGVPAGTSPWPSHVSPTWTGVKPDGGEGYNVIDMWHGGRLTNDAWEQSSKPVFSAGAAYYQIHPYPRFKS